MPQCVICKGDGYLPIPNDPTSRMMCRCTLESLYASKLGQEVFNSPVIPSSEFEKHINDNLFIVSNRKEMMPHLRHCLISQGLNFFSRITNDSQMLDAWLSKTKDRAAQEYSDVADFTSLSDLVEDPALLVIFLRVVSYPNKALPGVLLQALNIRAYAGKPTWIVNPHSFPYTSGHLCWSEQTELYIQENFESKVLSLHPSFKPIQSGTVTDQKLQFKL